MKKLFLTMLGVALAATPALRAQDLAGLPLTPVKVNVDKLKNDIAKSDAEIADAKKNTKSATWIKRGNAFIEAEKAPVSGLFAGLAESTLKLSYGETATQEITGGGVAYTVYPYEHFNAYANNGQVQFFIPTTIVDPNALDKAYEAYDKAYTMDPKIAKRVAAGMEDIRIRAMENGGAHYSLDEFKPASENFRKAFRASVHPSVAKPDTTAIFFAGMSSVWGEDYKSAVEDLDKALELGYEANGETYRLKFLAMYNLGKKDESLKVLQDAVKRYPANEDIIDMLLRYYAENEGDPTSLIPMVQEAIAQNPENANLYQGLARIYDKLGQSDNAIEAIKNATRLLPNDFLSNYLEGYFIIKKGDDMNVELRNMPITSRDQYQSALANLNKVFAEAIAPLEKAFAVDPSEIAPVELLKNLTYRLRDDEAMNVKYEKYLEIFNSMNQK